MKQFDLIALGEAMVEFNQTAPNLSNYLQGFGGDTSNAAIAAARAGAKAAYISRVGNDAFGKLLLRLWQREGVDTTGVAVDDKAPTGVYFVSHGEQGHEFSYLRKGSAASLVTPDLLPRRLIEQSRILHVSAISQAISASANATVLAAMQHARSHGTLVAFDPNLRLRLWTLEAAKAAILQALALTDIFLPSIDDVTQLTGLQQPADIVAWAHAQGATQVALKLGGDGALVSNGQRTQHIAALPLPLPLPLQSPVFDATGAGDCFCGNLLARMAMGDDVFVAARYANAAASLAVQGFGAVAPLPSADQVLALLALPSQKP